jgi:dihydrofolate reductase
LKVAVVSFAADEAWDALLDVKTTEAGTTTAVVGGSALCFLLYPSHVADDISLFNPQSNFCNMYFSIVICPNLIFPTVF